MIPNRGISLMLCIVILFVAVKSSYCYCIFSLVLNVTFMWNFIGCAYAAAEKIMHFFNKLMVSLF